MRIGALEAGGTKMVLAVLDDNAQILDRVEFPTEDPGVTIPKIASWFLQHQVNAIGIGLFGPVCVNPDRPNYGQILATPKLAWRWVNVKDKLQEAIDVPILIDTDVNVACLGESLYGSAQGLKNVIYITVGTGIGAGILCEGNLVHGMLHPEAGHMLIERYHADTFEGTCPCHSNCLESLASGPAIERRWGKPARNLADQQEVWDLEAHYLAQGISNLILAYAPQRIILGGGVMKQEQLFKLIRSKVFDFLNDYLTTDELSDMDNYIVPAGCSGDQGILGAYSLGAQAYKQNS